MAREPRIVRRDEVETNTQTHGDMFLVHRKALSRAAGGERLGCSLYELPPGRHDFPYHAHHGNEEALYVLDGEATLRLDGAEHIIKTGDYVAIPAGHDSAHQVHNTSPGPFRFLMMSTLNHPDVIEYPDSDKLGAFAGRAPGGAHARHQINAFFRCSDEVEYFDGE